MDLEEESQYIYIYIYLFYYYYYFYLHPKEDGKVNIVNILKMGLGGQMDDQFDIRRTFNGSDSNNLSKNKFSSRITHFSMG